MPNLVIGEEKRQLLSDPYKKASNTKLFIVLLAAVVMLPSLSIDSCLASLPNIGFSLHAPPAATALILSLFMAGFAVGQIIFGPLCDRLGRRPALLIGCAVFTIAAFGWAIAPSLNALVFCRFLQGIGAAAGPVISFAIVQRSVCWSRSSKTVCLCWGGGDVGPDCGSHSRRLDLELGRLARGLLLSRCGGHSAGNRHCP